jgi:hypothetical protein
LAKQTKLACKKRKALDVSFIPYVSDRADKRE